MKKVALKLVILTIIFFVNYSNAVDVIRFPWAGHPGAIQKDYYLAALELALKKSEAEFGPYKLVKFEIPINQSRAIKLIEHERMVDIMWTTTSIEREKILEPIRIPIVKGAMGCRIFLIRKEEQYRFDEISNIEQLKALYVGQGRNWPDTKVLKHNGFNVVDGSEYSGMFDMLKLNRFDYFPRGVHEPWREQELFNHLAVEERFLLQYPSPFFFFVNKANQKLAKRVQIGLEMAIKDGDFDKLFNQHEETKVVLSNAKLSQRKIFLLDNPFLTDETKALFEKGAPYELDCATLAVIEH